jgi:hypothetical protein
VKNHVVDYRITAQLVADNLKQGSELVLNNPANDVRNVFCAGWGEGVAASYIRLFRYLYVSDLGLHLL